MSNLYLIGMMGSGKTVTGKKLAEFLECEFVDLDEELKTRTGEAIMDLFKKKGETAFRDEESKILREFAQGTYVVATGGGVILRPENTHLMRETGKVIFLKTTLETLWSRVKGKHDRPLLQSEDPKEALRKIYDHRTTLYHQAADLEVDTDGLGAETVAKKILEQLRSPSLRGRRRRPKQSPGSGQAPQSQRLPRPPSAGSQ